MLRRVVSLSSRRGFCGVHRPLLHAKKSYLNVHYQCLRYFSANEGETEEISKTDQPLGKSLTPGMRQYLRMKESVPGYILLFQMGDFFEIFYEDAILASKLLDLTLTSRHKSDHAIPMCGIPLHTVETYIGKLIQKGQMVAVCEQVTEGNKQHPAATGRRRKSASPLAKVVGGSGGVVKREITRLVSPGTLIEDHLLQPRTNNYLASVHYELQQNNNEKASNLIGLTWMDLSTGDFHYASLPSAQELRTELHRINPAEIICSYQLKAVLLLNSSSTPDEALKRASSDIVLQQIIKQLAKQQRQSQEQEIAESLTQYRITPRAQSDFTESEAQITFSNSFNAEQMHQVSQLEKLESCSAGALLQYIRQTQKGGLPSLSLPKKHIINDIMHIDSSTFQCLELVQSNSPESSKTLLSTIDYTVTGPGARLLASRLVSPLISPDIINERLDCVEFFYQNEFVTETLREMLKRCHDMERSLQRVSLRKCGPRDLSAISQTIGQLQSISQQMGIGLLSRATKIIETQSQELLNLHNHLQTLHVLLSSAIIDNPSVSIHTGGFIKKGYCNSLDQVHTLQSESKEITGRLQAKYRSILGINSLKIKSNLVLGMHIEVPVSYHEKVLQFNSKIQSMPQSESTKDPLDLEQLLCTDVNYRHLLMHCQSMPSAMRYKTEEISLLDQRIQRAEFEVKEHEERIFSELVGAVLEYSSYIRSAANLIASVDVSSSLGLLAKLHSYCRPIITTQNAVDVRNGRHPVVESVQQARQRGGEFTPNDMVMGEQDQRVFLLTGPNMGGKSTYLRQVAIHAIMAQSGSFIPADSAKIGIFDRIFSRVGAADDLKNDQSTFMMEMQEAAQILKMATPRSLIIVDELGRGTSTMEGLSIAWAVLEHLHNVSKCRTIFATHYHELAKLKEILPQLRAVQMEIMEDERTGVIAFLHKVIDGVADKSYGVHVAKLAGLPDSVTSRAEVLLSTLINDAGTKELNVAQMFDNLPISHREDKNAHYIKIDKEKGNFPDVYQLLCDIVLNKK